MKRALIFGITGQDGSYLAELLSEKGYDVAGVVRRSSSIERERLDHLRLFRSEHAIQNVRLLYGDLSDGSSIYRLIAEFQPDEVYNLGAQSHVKVSFDVPEYTADVNGLGAIRVLEAIRATAPSARFYQASTSELYGNVGQVPQSEATPFQPRSPYAAAKALAFAMTRNYREAYGMFAANGILFNHESPRRSPAFVTRKVTKAAAEIKVGLARELVLGNLDARRDWGYAVEYVEAMWRMLQVDRPDDYVIATGETHSVRELLDVAFGRVGLDWQQYVVLDDRYRRPTEVDLLIGDASKAERELGFTPRTRFKELIELMVDADLERATARASGSLDP